MNLPKISIIIPSYNKSKYLTKTIESIIGQDYPNLEIIIKDGGSTDKSVEIIKKYATRFPKIIRWSSGKDLGQADAINKGIRNSTGEIVSFLNADDVYKKGALLAVGQAFAKNPGSLWAIGLGSIIDNQDRVIFHPVSLYKNILSKLNKYALLLTVNYITQASVFINKKSFIQYGPFISYGSGYVMEYDLWLKLGKVQMPLIINEYLASFRLVKDNASVMRHKELLLADSKIVKKHTSNRLVLFLHNLHNLGRVKLAILIK